MITIGILDLQGAVKEHIDKAKRIIGSDYNHLGVMHNYFYNMCKERLK